jgi:type II secretory pathway pseudopilin PulG
MKFARPPRPNLAGAFSLLELMVVVGIMIVGVALAVPALTRSENLTNAVYTLQGVMDQARTYAVANNTYTWVGVFEEDGASTSQTPGKSGTGRVVLCIVASQDGTSVYNKRAAESGGGGTSQKLDPTRLALVGKLVRLEGVHILDAAGTAIGKRPAGLVRQEHLVGLATGAPLFTFNYPLTGTATYTFGQGPGPGANGIIQFNPQGEAISAIGPVGTPVPNLEISLQPAHGNTPGSNANLASLNLSGLTGQTTIYRP